MRIDPRGAGLLARLVAGVGGRLAGTGPMNLFLVLGRHPRLFRNWLRFAAHLMPGGTLRRRESELVVLRVAYLRDCDYERVQHERIGRRSGLGEAEIARVRTDAEGWSPREAALLSAVDAMHRHGDIDDTTWTRLREHLSERECVELCLLAGHYQMLATTITALRIQPEHRRRR